MKGENKPETFLQIRFFNNPKGNHRAAYLQELDGNADLVSTTKISIQVANKLIEHGMAYCS